MTPNTQQDERARLTAEALLVANEMCTAVIGGRVGQQAIALRFARVLDVAKRAGIDILNGVSTYTTPHR